MKMIDGFGFGFGFGCHYNNDSNSPLLSYPTALL